MSKAEERASKLYPYENGVKGLICENSRQLFIQGYEYAEKDLELTWEDAQLLHIITEKYMRELDNRIEAYPSSSQELFEEVLRRFNEHKK